MRDNQIIAASAGACAVAIIVGVVAVFSCHTGPERASSEHVQTPLDLPPRAVASKPSKPLSKVLNEDVSLVIDAEPATRKPYVVTGKSNLPRGAVLVVSVERDGPNGMIGQDMDCLLDSEGRFSSHTLGPLAGLEPGEYEVSVVMPIPSVQPQFVRDVIGEQGEYLKGALVEHGRMGVSVTVQRNISVPGDPIFRSLHDAAGRGNVASVQRFIDAGANVNAVDKHEWTALHLAAEWSHRDVVQVLLKAGAIADAKNNAGETPLYLAAQEGAADVVKLLLERGAKVDLSNQIDETPLQQAVIQGHAEVVLLLINAGANVNKSDDAGDTVLRLAKRLKHDDIVALLRKSGAKE